tara:strand:- start:212 stop:649 length:438 start_codon:yes stop_codon:yes gene_type:complete
MSKYSQIKVDVYQCSLCHITIDEDQYYDQDGNCGKCSIVDQFINSLPTELENKLGDHLLTIDKRGLCDILADTEEKNIITALWDILNLFNPNGTDNDPTLTFDEWDEICTQMAWITEDIDDKPKYVNLDGTLCRNGRPIDECNCC